MKIIVLETFTSILQDFVEKEPAINALGKLIKDHAYQGIYETTHDLLPALTYIGAYNLAKQAKSIESIIFAKEQASTPEFKQQLNNFHQAMLALVEKIRRQLSQS